MTQPHRNIAGHASRADSWSRYWASGRRHSCPGSFDGHYGPATQAFWRDRFSAIGEADRVLEIGCGNGSLISFMARASAMLPRRVDAIDLARIDGSWVAELPHLWRSRVHVHPGIAFGASLPLAPAGTHHLYGQYAFEYFCDDAAWDALLRVLAPRASVAFVAHARGSRLYEAALAERAHCDWVLAAHGPLDAAEAIVPWAAQARGTARSAEGEQVRLAFNATFAALEQRATAPFGDLLTEAAGQVMGLLRDAAARGAPSTLQALAALRQNVADNRLRVAELVDCALDRPALDSWGERLASAGFGEVELAELREHGHWVGWTLAARRGHERRMRGS